MHNLEELNDLVDHHTIISKSTRLFLRTKSTVFSTNVSSQTYILMVLALGHSSVGSESGGDFGFGIKYSSQNPPAVGIPHPKIPGIVMRSPLIPFNI